MHPSYDPILYITSKSAATESMIYKQISTTTTVVVIIVILLMKMMLIYVLIENPKYVLHINIDILLQNI